MSNVGTRLDVLKINGPFREPVEPVLYEVFQYKGKFVKCLPKSQAPTDKSGERLSCPHCLFNGKKCWALVCCRVNRIDGTDVWFDEVQGIRPGELVRYYGRIFRITPSRENSHIERDKILAEFGKVPGSCEFGVELCGTVPPVREEVVREFEQFQKGELDSEKL